MKASELIKKLQDIVESYGDLEVCKNDECGGCISYFDCEIETGYDKNGDEVKFIDL